ncbi:MAG TPA: ABC transporter permease subunit [Solirubrobacteraceae bacterium]|jgi:phosphate transport system permease protein|nr:ABC transporter permease subunit [Solirubrobacteraceae bacterium]
MSTLVSHPISAADRSGIGPRRGRGSSMRTWRWSDRLLLLAAWAAGLTLCAIAAAIVLYMGYRGIQYLSPELIFSRPQASLTQAGSGGFLDPLLGTMLLTVIGVAIAAPLAICSALWIVEYGRPNWLARVVESGIEIVAGTPDIVIAFFGLAIFQLHLLSFASETAEGGGVTGRSFLAAGAMMSLIALPPIFVTVRDGLQTVPSHMREAAFALGKTRIATIRRVLLPGVRSNIATGVTLGVSRIIADTAIVIVLLGSTLRISPQPGGAPVLGVLKGLGSTLTSYIYENSPAGEGGAPQKAYAAAFVLMLFVLALNLVVERISRAQARSSGFVTAVEGIV